ncbi:hypothetical protein [Mycolicibacterium chlorophenolicum]|uniref:Uncharacterized protein n=1 Tax=Mycolicibacterium chlorophenolicum TaxID=37916 RepID=A0A0J6WPN7_9MYCO|nr:hypothetical protein [Mycolicibacterium chlorophenolicum]KMO83667.1 hypothetical protein MCHLDSM_00319 [Mycolicibacterium chlorophenolicum]
MRDTRDPAVVEWLDNEPTELIWTTSVTVFEIGTGIELLTPSRRRKRLDATFAQLLSEDLDGRVQSFDLTAAMAAASTWPTPGTDLNAPDSLRMPTGPLITDISIVDNMATHSTTDTRGTHPRYVT